jgi:hypothetical protein
VSIAAFLTARLEEDEALAKAAQGLLGIEAPWHTVAQLHDRGITRGDASHIARHSPARELREVTAKRSILRTHKSVRSSGKVQCEGCLTTFWPCPDLKDIASAWSDHPGYDQAWKP